MAAWAGPIEFFIVFLMFYCRYGARVDIPDENSKRVLHKAAYLPDIEYLQAILKRPGSMSSGDLQNEEGATPLMLACQSEELSNVKELVAKEVSMSEGLNGN